MKLNNLALYGFFAAGVFGLWVTQMVWTFSAMDNSPSQEDLIRPTDYCLLVASILPASSDDNDLAYCRVAMAFRVFLIAALGVELGLVISIIRTQTAISNIASDDLTSNVLPVKTPADSSSIVKQADDSDIPVATPVAQLSL